LAEALLAIVTVVAVTTVVLSVREGIYLPRAFMLVVLMLGGNHSLLDLESR
jgi:hypothetical protein